MPIWFKVILFPGIIVVVAVVKVVGVQILPVYSKTWPTIGIIVEIGFPWMPTTVLLLIEPLTSPKSVGLKFTVDEFIPLLITKLFPVGLDIE